MMYETERTQILSEIEKLLKEGLLNRGGGAVSLRIGNHILMTCSGCAFRRWEMDIQDFIVIDYDGNIVEKTGRLGSAGLLIHCETFKLLPLCNAIVHTHAPYSLVYAYKEKEVPQSTHAIETLGEIPCFTSDDKEIKIRFENGEFENEMAPEGQVRRNDVYVINKHFLMPQITRHFTPRKEELEKHGLGFLASKHGVYTMGRHLAEATENLERIETAARTALYSSLLEG